VLSMRPGFIPASEANPAFSALSVSGQTCAMVVATYLTPRDHYPAGMPNLRELSKLNPIAGDVARYAQHARRDISE